MSLNKVAFFTLGCKVNQYETECIKKKFRENGYEEVDFNKNADIYIVNSCTVTKMADRKTRNMLRRAKKINNNALVVVTGCYAQTNAKELEEIEEIDIIIGNEEKENLFEIIRKNIDGIYNEKTIVSNIFELENYVEMGFSTFREMTRAYIKIQDGCDNFCSYCKIPFARGHKRSREIKSILDEVKTLANEGFKEIILIGINLGAYGEDLSNDDSLEKVIEVISCVEGIERIRLGSIYPDRINTEFIKILKNNKKLMPHLHISLQSGDNEILGLMKRKYKREDVLEKLSMLKKEIENIEYTGDIIVGFPSEKEENFINSYNLLKESTFSDLHIFQYSDREKTLASSFKEKVSSYQKKERAEKLEELRIEMFQNSRKKYIGKSLKILIEENKNNEAIGYTENYLKAKVLNYKGEHNKIIAVKVIKLEKGLLICGKEGSSS